MIVCALLVSNFPRRNNTWGSLTPTIHTHNNVDADYNMMPPFFLQQPIFCSWKATLSFNREQPQSPLPCHDVIVAACIAVASTPDHENARASFLRETGRVNSNCARSASSVTCGDNEVDHAVCFKAELQMHTALSNENDKFYTTMIYPSFSRSVCFSMGSPAWWRFGLCSSGSSLVSRWRDAPLVHARISNATSQMLTNRSALISWASNAFLWML